MKLRLRWVGVAALAVAATLTVVLLADGGADGQQRPKGDALLRLQSRVESSRTELGQRGIYLANTGLTGDCVSVGLSNPTEANIAWMRGRFGGDVCVERQPSGPVQACTGYHAPPVPRGRISVPDLTDLGLFAAESRIVEAGLRFALDCPADHTGVAKRPSASSPEALVRITAQCPRPGQRVPAGTVIAIEARAILPGGFRYEIGTLNQYVTDTDHPCRDGRNPN